MLNIRPGSLSIALLVASVIPIAFGLSLVRRGYVAIHRRPYVPANGWAILGAGIAVVFALLILDASAAAALLLL